MQGSPRRVERVVLAVAVSVGGLLHPASALVQRVTGQTHHVEGIHHRDRVGECLVGGGLEPGEPVHRHHLHPDRVTPSLRSFAQPGLERLLGAALNHVEQPGWAGAVTDGCEVDDHGDVLVAASSVAPHMLIDGEVLAHDRFDCPPQPAARELRAWFGCAGGVLAPYVPAAGAA